MKIELKELVSEPGLKPELLSPAGNMASLKAAIEQGCDAVYLGGTQFNARHGAENFTAETLPSVIDYCHLRGVKAYLTVNTLYGNEELTDVLTFASKMVEEGIDALIVQDIGFAKTIKSLYPKCALHASTQMTVQTADDARFLQALGFERAVLARELTLDEISEICLHGGLETEVFVHGAMCMGYSGQCLMSAFLGGRSGNRGQCAQPCRLPYSLSYNKTYGKIPRDKISCSKSQHYKNEKISHNRTITKGHLLSPKDLMAIDIIPELARLGVHGLKIEGRMKSPEYVGAVTRAYRRQLDSILDSENSLDEASLGKVSLGKVSLNKTSIEESRHTLAQVFNRGFSTGFFWGANANADDSMSVKNPQHTGILAGKVRSYDPKSRRCIVDVSIPLFPGDGIAIGTEIGTGINRIVKPGETYQFRLLSSAEVRPRTSEPRPGEPIYKTLDKSLTDTLKAQHEQDTRTIQATAQIFIAVSFPIRLTLSYTRPDGEVISVTASGELAQLAIDKPLSSENIIARLSKTGGTGVQLVFKQVEIHPNIFIPVSSLNQLRRSAIETLQEAIIQSYKATPKAAEFAKYPDLIVREASGKNIDNSITSPSKSLDFAIEVRSIAQLEAVFQVPNILGQMVRVYVASTILQDYYEEFYELCKTHNVPLFVALPRVAEKHAFSPLLSKLEVDGYLIRTWGQLQAVQDARIQNMQNVLDYSLHIYNQVALDTLQSWGDTFTLHPELPQHKAVAIQGETEYIIYGRLPWMITRRCPIRLYANCINGRDGGYILVDRKNAEYPIVTGCQLGSASPCMAELLGHQPIDYTRTLKTRTSLPFKSVRFIFTTETPEEIAQILHSSVKNKT